MRSFGILDWHGCRQVDYLFDSGDEESGKNQSIMASNFNQGPIRDKGWARWGNLVGHKNLKGHAKCQCTWMYTTEFPHSCINHARNSFLRLDPSHEGKK